MREDTTGVVLETVPLLEEVIAAVITNLIDQFPMRVADLGHCRAVDNDFATVRHSWLQLVHPFGTRPEVVV